MLFENAYLYRTSYGSVLRCACCGRIEVRCFDAHLILTDEQFDAMRSSVKGLKHCQTGGTARWRITTRERGRRSSVEFDDVDVDRLHDLLSGAAAMIELGQLLDDRAIASSRDRE